MAAPAVEAFEGWVPAAPEAVGEAVDGEPLAEDVDAVGDPELALLDGDPPGLLIGLEVDGDPDEVPGLLMPPVGPEGEVVVAGWGCELALSVPVKGADGLPPPLCSRATGGVPELETDRGEVTPAWPTFPRA